MRVQGTPRRAAEEIDLDREGSDGRLRRTVVYENERKPLLLEKADSDRGFHKGSLLPGERPAWSDSRGDPLPSIHAEGSDRSLLPSSRYDVVWEWEEAGSWQVITEAGHSDEEGGRLPCILPPYFS
jgi:hypothetical protein